MATVTRLRARPSLRHIEALQGVLDIGGWPEPTRVALNERLTDLCERGDPEPRWRFVMLAANRETVAGFLAEVMRGPRGKATLACWIAIIPFVKRDDGLVLCSQRTLAETAQVALGDAGRAIRRLVEIGALQAIGDGRYRVHPTVMWHGRLPNREQAEAAAPVLSLV